MAYASSTVTKRNNINQREKRKLKASLLGVANNNSVEWEEKIIISMKPSQCVSTAPMGVFCSGFGVFVFLLLLLLLVRMVAGMHTIRKNQ